MMRHLMGKVSFKRKLQWATIGIAALAGLRLFGPVKAARMQAQSPPTAAAPSLAFEVASIKVDRSGDLRVGAFFRPGRFTARAGAISLIIAVAYNVHPFQISGGPSWVESDRYDIQAKESDATAEELRKLPPAKAMEKQALLLQSLLADRFHLKVSHQLKELPIYALVIAKNGPKLQEPKPDDKGPDIRMGPGQLTCRVFGMATLAAVLSNQMDRTVLDQTGLKGNYDFTLQWSRDQTMAGMPREQGGGGAGPDAAPLDSSGPSFFTALQEQVGLKLESTKGPVDVIVIEHIERPTEN